MTIDMTKIVAQVKQALVVARAHVVSSVPDTVAGGSVTLFQSAQLASSRRSCARCRRCRSHCRSSRCSCSAGAVAVAPDRRRALLWTGVTAIVAMLALGVGLALLRNAYVSAPPAGHPLRRRRDLVLRHARALPAQRDPHRRGRRPRAARRSRAGRAVAGRRALARGRRRRDERAGTRPRRPGAVDRPSSSRARRRDRRDRRDRAVRDERADSRARARSRDRRARRDPARRAPRARASGAAAYRGQPST